MRRSATRREFLGQSAVAAAALAFAGVPGAPAAGSRAEVPAKIIDTHTHFYDPTRPQGVPWPAKDDPLLYRRVLPADYRALPQPQAVHGTVVVEASAWFEDNQWILDLAKDDPFIVGFVGHLTVGNDTFRPQLRKLAANRLFRGIRIGTGQLQESLARARFVDDLRFLADQDLALDVLGGPESLPEVAQLAKTVPNLRVIIDHVANVPIDGKAVRPLWREGMRAAAVSQNVFCKVSGLVEGTGRTDGTAPRAVEFYRPVLDAIWEIFGPDRLIYGSNWPVSERFAPCQVVQRIVAEFFAGKGPLAIDQVFWKNALAFYKWVDR